MLLACFDVLKEKKKEEEEEEPSHGPVINLVFFTWCECVCVCVYVSALVPSVYLLPRLSEEVEEEKLYQMRK